MFYPLRYFRGRIGKVAVLKLYLTSGISLLFILLLLCQSGEKVNALGLGSSCTFAKYSVGSIPTSDILSNFIFIPGRNETSCGTLPAELLLIFNAPVQWRF